MANRLSKQCERFLQVHLEGKSKHTALAYRNDLRQFEAWLNEQDLPLTPADADVVAEYLHWLETVQGRTKWSVHRAATSIRRLYAFLGDALPKGIYPMPPAGEKLPSMRRSLTLAEMGSLFAAIDAQSATGRRDRAIFMLMFGLGFLLKDVLDLDLHEIALKQRLLRPRGKHGNRNMVPRVVPLGGLVEEALRDWLSPEGRPHFAFHHGVEKSEKAVFVGRFGGRLTRQGLTHVLNRYKADVGLPSAVSPIWFRDSFTRHMHDNGAADEDVSLISGALSHVGPARNTMENVERFRTVLERHHPYW